METRNKSQTQSTINQEKQAASEYGKCGNSWKIAVREISRAHHVNHTRGEQRKCTKAAFGFSLFSLQPLFAGKSSCILSQPKKYKNPFICWP